MGLEVLFDRRTLLAAVNSPDLELRPRFLIDSYFKSSKSVFSDSVDWEEVLGDAGLASFRNSGAEAKVVGRTGKVMKTVTLPYIREKSEITAKALLRENALGDVYISNGSSIDAHRKAELAKVLKKLKNRILRREEWMAASFMTTGKLDYEDEETAFTIDLGLTSTYKPVMSGGDLWSDPTADIDGQLDDMSVAIEEATGLPGTAILLGTSASQDFVKNEKIKANLHNNNFRTGALNNGVKTKYIGTYKELDVYRYSHKYKDEAGAAQQMFPDRACTMVGESFADSTERVYGVVEEIDETFAGEVFSKSWVTEDPSARWVLCASRPLVVIKEYGSFVAARV